VLELLASQAAISIENARLYAELKRSEAFLADGQSISSTGSFGWKVASGELDWSDETYRIFEVERTIAPTLELALSRIHPDDRPARRHFIDLAGAIRANYEADYRLQMPDGRVKHAHILAHALRNASGGVEIMGTIMDTTAAKRAEEALRQAQEDLARASRVATLGELSASIAHEVNQPLAAVMNNANACLSLLSAGTVELREFREALKEIVEDAGRAGAVIARVRHLASKAPFTMTPLDLGEVIADVLALARTEIAARRVTVLREMPAGLPRVSGDRVQVQQVLLNLISNGMDAMSGIEESKRILVIGARRESGEGGKTIAVSVRDAGAGFAPGQKERLFEAFYTTKPQGMGMGLAISRSILEAHGGRLWAEANPGPGATFFFSLGVAGDTAA